MHRLGDLRQWLRRNTNRTRPMLALVTVLLVGAVGAALEGDLIGAAGLGAMTLAVLPFAVRLLRTNERERGSAFADESDGPGWMTDLVRRDQGQPHRR